MQLFSRRLEKLNLKALKRIRDRIEERRAAEAVELDNAIDRMVEQEAEDKIIRLAQVAAELVLDVMDARHKAAEAAVNILENELDEDTYDPETDDEAPDAAETEPGN